MAKDNGSLGKRVELLETIWIEDRKRWQKDEERWQKNDERWQKLWGYLKRREDRHDKLLDVVRKQGESISAMTKILRRKLEGL